MRKRIGIFVGQLYFPSEKMHKWDEENLFKGGIGGSEVWAIEIASKLEEKGYQVQLFADCEIEHFAENGVQYIPYEKFYESFESYEFDFFITSRRTDVLKYDIQCDNIFLMLHDPHILYIESEEDIHFEKIKGVFYQSEFQKKLLLTKYKCLNGKKFYRTCQALDETLYHDVSQERKKNKMLWSSHKIRGARILIEKILPIIRAEIPDFEIDVCGYVDDTTDEHFKSEGVNVLGNITKKELIQRQKESKIWIYPNNGYFDDGRINDETFCITAIENAMAKNALILADKTCFSDTLKTYKGFIGMHLFDGDFVNSSLIDDFSASLGRQAIELLKNEDKRQFLANNAYSICKKYTWEAAVNSLINAFEEEHLPEENEELILLTATLHYENLDKIFESIIKNFPTELNITWAIIKDGKAKEDFSPIISKCKEYQKENQNFSWFYYPNGNEETKNYGGTMFNAPLKWLKDNWFIEKNPWIYILDDDNTLSSLMMERIVYDIKKAKRSHKRGIIYNILYENGNLNCNDAFYCDVVVRGTDVVPIFSVLDPSQIVVQYSLLRDMGYYAEGATYDIDMHFKIIGRYRSDFLFPTEEEIGLNSYHTTHNAIVSHNIKKKWENIVNRKKDAVCGNLLISTNGEIPQVFHIDRQDLLEIYNKYILDENDIPVAP